MTQGAQLYRGEIELADSDQDRYHSLSLSTPLHPSESLERLVLRLLAHLLLYQPGITFRDGGVSQGEEPDLAVRDATGRISHWIEVGTPAEERLRKANRHTQVSVVTHEGLLVRWQRQHKNQLPVFDGEILILEKEMVSALTEQLARRFRWQATITGGTLYLENSGVSLTSSLRRIAAGRG